MKTIEAKVVVLGKEGVGKTSVVARHVSRTFNSMLSPTIGASFATSMMTIQNSRIKMQIWDTAGQERFMSMAPMYYRKANAAILVFDLTKYDTFLSVKTWVEELQKKVNEPLILIVLGNKCDLPNKIVDSKEAVEYSSSIGAMYFETSAKVDKGVEEAFVHLAVSLIKMVEDNIKCSIKSYSTDTLDGTGYYIEAEENDKRISIISETPKSRSYCC